jgi:hypothetical protein
MVSACAPVQGKAMATDFGKLILENTSDAAIANMADGEPMGWTCSAQALFGLRIKITLAQARRAKALFPTRVAPVLRTPLYILIGLSGAIQSSVRRMLATSIDLPGLSKRM